MTTAKTEDITPSDCIRYIKKHRAKELPRLVKLKKIYDGEQEILNRQKEKKKANNRIVINHAEYIADFTSAYLAGAPVTYSSSTDEDISELKEMLRKADSHTQDSDLSLDCAIYGRAYDMMYVNSMAQPALAKLSPCNTFVVYDDTVEQKPVFAVYYYPVYSDIIETNVCGYKCGLYTDKFIQHFETDSSFMITKTDYAQPHFFGVVPINEIYNKANRKGDYESIITLIDAYNLLQSDRVNNKEDFVNAILLLKGATLGDNEPEREETYEFLQKYRVMELPAEGADAGYLTSQFDESSVETLKQSIVSDIHKISGVPDMTDVNFASNASGVAIKYKLLGLEQKTAAKERFFAEGLRYRLKAFANFLAVKGGPVIDTNSINITFTRSLPAHLLEIAQTIATLAGIVPQESLLSLLPFIDNPAEALQKLKEEKAEELKAQAAVMNIPVVADEE